MKTESSMRYLCFQLGKEHYGIPLLTVKEVIGFLGITPLPQAQPHMLGLINLRGQIISVMDLRIKLGIKPSQSNEPAIIICDLNPNSVGVVVDGIDSVLNPKPDQISEAPDLYNARQPGAINGVFRDKERMILLLDVVKTLNLHDHRTIETQAQSVQSLAKAS